MIRIATAGFQHESNTFSSVPASLERWQRSGIIAGEEIRAEYATSQSTLAGFFAAAAEDKEVELVPLLFTRLTPMGAMTEEAATHIIDRIVAAIRDNGPWDAVLLPQHGAAVSDPWPDADGELVRRVRETVGPRVPIGLALDMHANVSPQMVANADITTVYQTNPHVDAREQALLCARLVLRMVRGQIRPRSALRMPPLLVNILNQGTSDRPMSDLLRVAEAQRRRPGVLTVSVVEGYPYADVAEMGMSFIAVTDGDQALADDVADTLAQAAWSMRAALNQGGTPIDDAVIRARDAAAGPVVLFDVGDNVGGGSPGDSTFLLHAARRLGAHDLLQALCDPDGVAACAAVPGVGRGDRALRRPLRGDGAEPWGLPLLQRRTQRRDPQRRRLHDRADDQRGGVIEPAAVPRARHRADPDEDHRRQGRPLPAAGDGADRPRDDLGGDAGRDDRGPDDLHLPPSSPAALSARARRGVSPVAAPAASFRAGVAAMRRDECPPLLQDHLR
jgi:microcystin degradation protein MlrC